MRAAIYFTPPADAPLTRAAAEWLGRCPFGDESVLESGAGADPLVEAAARYGFHATLKAPFRLAEGTDLAELGASLENFCATRRAVTIPRLMIGELGAFFAFVPEAAPPGLAELERAVVTNFEPFRAPLSSAELARRGPERLGERQRHNLERWGYPHVLDDFRFHMTLTGPVEPERRQFVRKRLERHFQAFDRRPLTIDRLAVFIEPEPGAAFRVHSIHSFGRPAARKEPYAH